MIEQEILDALGSGEKMTQEELEAITGETIGTALDNLVQSGAIECDCGIYSKPLINKRPWDDIDTEHIDNFRAEKEGDFKRAKSWPRPK